jgi:hypothetical protein
LFSKSIKQRLEKFSVGVNYENTNNFNSIFLSRYQPKQLLMDIFKLANGIPLNTFSSYGSLNSGAQQAFSSYNAYWRILIQIIRSTKWKSINQATKHITMKL